MNGIEADPEEIVLMRNNKPIARLVPEPQVQNALEALGDLYRTLDDDTADALADAVSIGKKVNRGTLNELRNPWAF
jgi:antitoxin (DNA-binding transcriptional repressor) of toxin-antitoxin stability system